MCVCAGSYEVKRVTWADQTSDEEDSGVPLALYAPEVLARSVDSVAVAYRVGRSEGSLHCRQTHTLPSLT